jgi:hypothetical protein
VNNNANFKVRLQFTGSNMTVDNGNRITFNNIAVHGTEIVLGVEENSSLQYAVYPNPVSDIINVVGIIPGHLVSYKLYAIDGKLIQNGMIENAQIDLSDLSQGLYLLQMESDGKIQTKKISKK